MTYQLLPIPSEMLFYLAYVLHFDKPFYQVLVLKAVARRS